MPTLDESAQRCFLRGLGVHFERTGRPRMVAGMMLGIAVAAGVGAAWGLQAMGMPGKALRFALAALAGWGVFLACAQAWTAHAIRDLPSTLEISKLGWPLAHQIRTAWWEDAFGTARTVATYDLFLEPFSTLAMTVPFLLYGTVLGLVDLIAEAPAFLAIATLDDWLARKLPALTRQSSTWRKGGTVRATWKIVLGLMLVLSGLGCLLP